jgi:DnaA N-terminal domain
MTARLQINDAGDDRLATAQEIKRTLQILIGSFPNAPSKADLSIYGVSLFDEVISESPSLRVLEAACRKLRRDSAFLPSIRDVLEALAYCATFLLAAPTVDNSNLGEAGDYLLRKLGEETYVAWFANLRIQDQSGTTVTLIAPTRFHCSYIYQRYDVDLLRAWQSFRSDVVAVRVIVVGPSDGRDSK